ncbi:heavy-metal-associated domain-containing protein [bacterium]|nr:heavy-metal-associated domain-containing protein [bacterium]
MEKGDRVTIRVEGMSCGGCASKVRDAILGACDCSSDIEADTDAGSVTFTCGCPSNLPDIAAAIDDAGFMVITKEA